MILMQMSFALNLIVNAERLDTTNQTYVPYTGAIKNVSLGNNSLSSDTFMRSLDFRSFDNEPMNIHTVGTAISAGLDISTESHSSGSGDISIYTGSASGAQSGNVGITAGLGQFGGGEVSITSQGYYYGKGVVYITAEDRTNIYGTDYGEVYISGITDIDDSLTAHDIYGWNFYPAADDDGFSLGGSTLRFTDLWMGGTAHIGSMNISSGIITDNTGLITTSSLNVSGNITSDYYFGSGKHLSELPNGFDNTSNILMGNGSNITANVLNANNITDNSLTIGAIVFTGTSGLLSTTNKFNYSTTTDLLILNTGEILVIGKNGAASTQATTVLNITGGAGGSASSGLSGKGSDIYIKSGTGGASTLGGSSDRGGSIVILTGSGGASQYGTPGEGGNLSLLTGNGGTTGGGIASNGGSIIASCGAGVQATGGCSVGGAISFKAGTGGANCMAGGRGGGLSISSGNGGSGSSVGGLGADLTFSSGTGGAGQSGGGSGGNFYLSGGNGASLNGNGGSAYFNPGAKSGSGTDGILAFAVNPTTGVPFGKTSVGSKSPKDNFYVNVSSYFDMPVNFTKNIYMNSGGNLTTNYVNASGVINAVQNYSINGVIGLTQVVQVGNSTSTGNCSLTFTGGILTSTNCV
jgi:hypothetical protein